MDRNRVMVAKLHLPFPLLSDPDGALLQHVGIWNAEQKIALPAIVVVDPAGTVRYRYVGEDFADRPGDDAIFAALDGVRSTPAVGQLAPAVAIQVSADQPEAQHKDGGRTPISVADLAVYYRGAFNAAGALKRRFGVRGTFSREALHEIDRYQRVVKSYQDALAKLPAL
jgi:hypothetical protein